MKKIISLCLMLVIAFALAISAGAAEGEPETTVPEEGPVLVLEYVDYCENEDYYLSLVDDKNYTLRIQANEEQQELERAKILEKASYVDELCPAIARHAYVPTQGWNIVSKGTYTMNGHSENSDLYTSYYFTGSSWYQVTVFNYNQTTPTEIRAYNVLSSQTTTICPAGEILKKKYTMSGTGATANTKHFYLRFSAPVKVTGTIERAR